MPLHIGPTTMVWQTTVTDDNGKRLAIITQTQIVIAPPTKPAPELHEDRRSQKVDERHRADTAPNTNRRRSGK